MSIGPLKFLHPAESLNKVKLMQIEKLTTKQILASLAPGEGSCLKTRSDGTVLDGHHRLQVLLSRGVENRQAAEGTRTQGREPRCGLICTG